MANGWTGIGEDLASNLKGLGEGLDSIATEANNLFKELNQKLFDNWQSDSAPGFNPKLNAFASIISFLSLSKNAIIASATSAASILAEDQEEEFVCDVPDGAPVVDVIPLNVLGDGGKMTKPAIRDARNDFVIGINSVIAKLNDFIKSITISLYDEGDVLINAFKEVLSSAAKQMEDALTKFVSWINTALIEEEETVTTAEKTAAAALE